MKKVLSKNLLIIILALCGVMLLSISFVFAYDKNLKVRMSLSNPTLSSDCTISMTYGTEGEVVYYNPHGNYINKDAITPISSTTLSLTFNTSINLTTLNDSYFKIQNHMISSALQLKIIGFLIDGVNVDLNDTYGGVVSVATDSSSSSSSNLILFPNTEYNKGAASTGYIYTYILEVTPIQTEYIFTALSGSATEADTISIVNRTLDCYTISIKYSSSGDHNPTFRLQNLTTSDIFALCITKLAIGNSIPTYFCFSNYIEVLASGDETKLHAIRTDNNDDTVEFTVHIVKNWPKFILYSSLTNNNDYQCEYSTNNQAHGTSNFGSEETPKELLSPTKIKLITKYNSLTNSYIYFKITNDNTSNKNGNNAIQLLLTGLMVNGKNVQINDEYSTIAEKTNTSSTSIPLLICPKDFVSNISNGDTVVLVFEVRKITPRYQLETSTDEFQLTDIVVYNENGATSTGNTTVFPKNVIKKGSLFLISGELNVDSNPPVTKISYCINNLVENQKLRLTILSFEIDNRQTSQNINIIRMDNNEDVTVNSVVGNSVEQKKLGIASHSSIITINIGEESNPTNGLRNRFPNYFASTGNPFVTITLSIEVIE